jgi:hypothetical protein
MRSMSIADDVRRLSQNREAGATRNLQLDWNTRERIANETSATALTVREWAEIVATQLKAERREILKHVERLFKLVQIQMKDLHEKMRVDRIAKRLIVVEMELLKLRKHLNLSKPS